MSKPKRSGITTPTIRVLMTGPDLGGAVGGVQTHVKQFLRAYSNQSSVNIEFFPTSQGLHKTESSYKKIARILSLAKPFREAATQHDIIHLNSSFGAKPLIRDCIYAAIAVFLVRKPVILQFHGGLATDVRILQLAPFRRILRSVFSRLSKILVLSKTQAQAFSQFFPHLGMDVVSNFIDFPANQCTRAYESPIRFLFIARIDRTKGIREIVAASQALVDKGLNFEVLMCGDGPDVSWLKSTLSGSTLQQCVSFCGRVHGRDKVAAFESCHVLLLPSKHREGFPYGILEAFSYEMPVIATDVGAIKDVVDPGVTGFLLDHPITQSLVERMTYFIENPTEAQRMGFNARASALRRFSFNELRRTFSAIYMQTIGT